ncbi:MAG: hypothetical protein QXF82_03225 [Nitrososphaeria archaeon]
MLDKIYAYYFKEKDSVVEETLHEHIENALDTIKNIENSKIGGYIHKNFPSIKNFYQISKMSIIFHDLGKVFYQKEPDKIKEYLSFKGHEFLSTFIFKKFNDFNKKLWDSNEIFGIDIVDPIKFAILFHHHAMGIHRREEMLRELPINNLIQSRVLFKLLIEDVENFLEPEDRTPFKKALEDIKNNISFLANIIREAQNELRNVWRNVWNNKNNKIFSLILLNILIVTDNIGASKKRGPSQSIFHQSINDFYINYLTAI